MAEDVPIVKDRHRVKALQDEVAKVPASDAKKIEATLRGLDLSGIRQELESAAVLFAAKSAALKKSKTVDGNWNDPLVESPENTQVQRINGQIEERVRMALEAQEINAGTAKNIGIIIKNDMKEQALTKAESGLAAAVKQRTVSGIQDRK